MIYPQDLKLAFEKLGQLSDSQIQTQLQSEDPLLVAVIHQQVDEAMSSLPPTIEARARLTILMALSRSMLLIADLCRHYDVSDEESAEDYESYILALHESDPACTSSR